MNLLQKLDRINFPYDILHEETIGDMDIFDKAKRTTLVYNQKGNITKVCFKLLGSHFPIDELTREDFASLDAACFISCADYIMSLLSLLPAKIQQLSITSCGLLAFPEELRRFADLKELSINRTRIKSLPEWLVKFTELEMLDVRNNMLASIPSEIGGLAKLAFLDVSANNLTALPDEIENLVNLTSLKMSWNELECLPDWMESLTNLTSLNIDRNEITEIPSWMQNFTNLTSLNIRLPRMKSFPEWVLNLPNLNSLSVIIRDPASLHYRVQDSTKLNTLNLSLSGLKSLPEWLQDLTNLTVLDISDCEVESLPDWMKNLTNLSSLNTYWNGLKNLPDWMENLTNLTSLNVGNNELKYLPDWLGSFTNLTSLDISSNYLEYLPDWMGNFTNLTSLSIGSNKLKCLPDWMESFTNLTSLDVSDNKLKYLPDWMGKLTNLTSLCISHSELAYLPDWMEKLTSLNVLHAYENELTSLPDWFQGFTNLTSLDVGRNKLPSLPSELQNLTNLCELRINENKLPSVPSWINNLSNLHYLDVSENYIRELPNCFGDLHSLMKLNIFGLHLDIIPYSIVQLSLPFDIDNRYRGLFDNSVGIYGVTLRKMDISLFEQSHELIEAYYQGEHIPLQECKVIFLGDGEVGKSSLIDRMMFDQFDPNKKSTDGIRIEDWQPDGFEGMLRIWDFGGQEIMHSMHNCFLTSGCVYVIVLSGRENTFIDRKALHWLEVVQSFASESSIIIVVNKNDRKPYTSIPIEKLKEKYPDVIYDYFETSAQEGLNISRLTQSIIECAKQTEGYNYKFNTSMKNVKDNIAETKEYYIHNDTFRDMCESFGIESQEVQVGLLRYFKDLGVSFYYQDKPGKEKRPSMEGYTVLKPDWLTNGIYRLINRAGDNNGIISHEHIYEILNRSHENDVIEGMVYSKEETEYILFVMRLFRLSYKLESENEDYEFIPLMGTKDMPPAAKAYKEGATLHLSWESEFIPFNALYQIMVEMYNEINYENTWRYGAVFNAVASTATVFIEMDIKEERIDIYVKSKSKDEREVLHRYRNCILQVLKRLGRKPDEYVHVTNKEGKVGKIEYTTVLNRYDRGKEVYIKELDEDYDAAELLGIYYPGKEFGNSINIGHFHHYNGAFMPDYRISAKSAGDSPISLNINQGDGSMEVTQQISFGERFPSVTAQQYEELILLLGEFMKSKDFKELSQRKRRELKAIIKDKSHVSGWKKFSSFISDAKNIYVITSLVRKYGPRLYPWLREIYDFLIQQC